MSKIKRQDFLDLLSQCNPRTRKTTFRLIEGKADQDAAAFVQEKMDFIDMDGTVRSVDLISSRTCSFGHLQDQQTRLTSVCERCGAYTCSSPGCSFTCLRCGGAFCRRHIHIFSDGKAYCNKCRFFKWLRILFDL